MTFVDKPWGSELIWAITDDYAAKVITIDAGRRLSLQYHERKVESIMVIEGRMVLHLEDDGGNLQPVALSAGEHAHVPAGRIHRFEAIEPTKLVEVSTPDLEDVVRLEDDYGREGTTAP